MISFQKITVWFLISLFCGLAIEAGGQENDGNIEENWEHKHRFGPFIGYAFVPNLEGQIELVPVIGLDYEYWFHPKFALGLSNDLDALSYSVETREGVDLEREFAFVSSLNLVTKPVAAWIISVGAGIELEQNKNFGVFRMSTGYEFELNHRVDLQPLIAWEMKGKAEYHALNFGLVVGLNWRK